MSVEEVSPPTGEGSGQSAVPLPRIFFNFWFKMGHFLKKIVVFRQKGGIAQCSPLNTPLRVW